MIATSVAGLMLATSTAEASPPPGGSSSLPTSTLTPTTTHSVHYCVSGYAPDRAVSVRDEQGGATTAIHTNNRGAGCADVPVAGGCRGGGTQTLVATGTAADGNPGTSSAKAAAVSCGEAARSVIGDSHRAGGTSVTHVAIGIVGACGLTLVIIGFLLVGRRRSRATG